MKRLNKCSKKMRKAWNQRARENPYYWADSSKEYWDKEDFYQKGEKQALEFVVSFFKEKGLKETDFKKMRVLDLGCGTGRIASALAKYFKFVDGIDISEKMIETAKRDHPGIKNLQFHLGNGIDLKPFPDNFFDFIFSFLVFQHIPEKSIIINYLREIHRVLKPGRYMKIQARGYPCHLPLGLPFWRYKGFNSFYIVLSQKKKIIPFPAIYKYDTVHGVFFKEKELREIIHDLGFSQVKTFYHHQESRYLWATAKKL